VRLALWYVGSCVGVLWMYCMRLAASIIRCGDDDDVGCASGAVRWPTSGAPLGSQSLSVVAALKSAGWSPEAGQWAV